jgi:hypothetical protein
VRWPLGASPERRAFPERGFGAELTIPADVAELRGRGIRPGVPALPDRALRDRPAGLMVASEFTHLRRIVALPPAS